MSKIVDGIVKDIKSVPEKVKAKFKGGNLKKLLLLNFPYLLLLMSLTKWHGFTVSAPRKQHLIRCLI